MYSTYWDWEHDTHEIKNDGSYLHIAGGDASYFKLEDIEIFGMIKKR